MPKITTVAKINYTKEATLAIVAAYMLSPTKETVVELATKFGKTTRSIVAKLSREGVYKKAEYVSKNGKRPETKEEKVSTIAGMLGVSAEKLAGLEAATKSALDLIVKGLAAKKAEATSVDAEMTAEMETAEKAIDAEGDNVGMA